MSIEIDTEKVREQIEILGGIDKQIKYTCASIMMDTNELRNNDCWNSRTASGVYASMDDFDEILKEYSRCINTVMDYLNETVSFAYDTNQHDTDKLVDSNIDLEVEKHPNTINKVDGYDVNKEYEVQTLKNV